MCVCVVCVVVVYVCVCMWCVCVRVPRHESNTNLNVVTGLTVLATGPVALHARCSVNVSSGQRLMLSLPSPFARPSTENLHREQRVRHLSDWVLGVCVCVHMVGGCQREIGFFQP